jgi:hypothetical protein
VEEGVMVLLELEILKALEHLCDSHIVFVVLSRIDHSFQHQSNQIQFLSIPLIFSSLHHTLKTFSPHQLQQKRAGGDQHAKHVSSAHCHVFLTSPRPHLFPPAPPSRSPYTGRYKVRPFHTAVALGRPF